MVVTDNNSMEAKQETAKAVVMIANKWWRLPDLKILSNLAQNEPYSFKAVVDEVKSQVKLPLLNHSEVQYEEAIEKNLLFVGEFVPKDTRDIQARFVMAKDEKNDPFGTRRQDFPYFMKELEKKHAKQFPSIKQMKKLPSDYYDDLPEIEDDDDVQNVYSTMA